MQFNQLKRRDFIALLGGAAVAWPLAALAQQSERVRRIGVLMSGSADDPDALAQISAFAQGLQERGWSVGGNVRIDYRWGAGDVDRAARVWGIVAAVSLVDIGTLDLAAGKPLSGFDDGAQRVAVIRIAGQRPGMQHELTTRCPRIGGDDGSLHTELVRGAGLALADALHLRSVEGIQLPAALALLLRTDLSGAREWPGECRLEVRVACYLASHVADDPAKPGAQNAQLSAVAVELFGMRITRCHHGGALGDAHVRLPQPHAVLPGQPGQPLDRSVQKLRIGREGNVLGLHGGIDRDAPNPLSGAPR